MPYCPKCDMEFVDGITVCSDCGGPLFTSPEEAKTLREAQEQKALEEFLAQVREEGQDQSPKSSCENNFSLKTQENSARSTPDPSSVYVKKSDRCQDMNSSASAFLIVGCFAFLLAGLTLTGILPFSGFSRFTFAGAFGAMGAACLVVSIKTKKEAAGLKKEAEQENQEMEEIISWFVQTHPAIQLTQKLAEEQQNNQPCSPEEESLKLFELIQDYLITEKDLPDQNYVDALSEEIYHRLFEQEAT